jgi:ribosomal protein S18 acetylase RimI-like enzyme
MRQSATLQTLFDVPRYSNLVSWLAPVSVVTSSNREDESYRRQMIHQSSTLWETEAGEAIAFAMVPFATSLRFGIVPEWRTMQLTRTILAWGVTLVQERCHVPFLMVRCHEQDTDLQAALTQEGFAPESHQDVYMTRPLDTIPVAPDLPAGFRLQAGVTVEEHPSYQGLHEAIFGHGMGMDEHFSSSYQPELDLLAVAPDGSFAGVCFCTMDQVADIENVERIGGVWVLAVHPAYRRLGLGRTLLLSAMQRVCEHGASHMVLETENEDSPAMKLYCAEGFQPGSPWRWWCHKL